MLEVRTSFFRAARRKAHLTMLEAAEKLGIDRSTLSRYETGKTKVKADVLFKMASIYGIPLEELAKETE
ncbi:MAG: helix-turn-helix transcriptional regulator [Anaerovibrio sp.]|nr:helix-turn-helix transcriptional regulator [Anaerovibrio sp.]